MATVQVYRTADAQSLAVQLADEAVEIGPPQAQRSPISTSRRSSRRPADLGRHAVHPGYGFLAENADFADAVEAAGLTFVGPSGDAIRLMGDKVAARGAAAAAGVPTVPGSDGRVDGDRGRAPVCRADRLSGDDQGGRRRRRARHPHRAATAPSSSACCRRPSAEAKAAFGDGGLYMEKVIEKARHIEVQVLGDGERRGPLLRARMLAAATPPEGLGGGAVARRCRRGCAQTLCASAVALAQCGQLSRRRHARVSLRRQSRAVLLHRDEHPHPGRASGDRDDHRHRSGARDAADRRRRAVAAAPARYRASAAMPSRCASTPRTRRSDFMPLSRHRRARCACRAGRACASTPCSIPATRCRRSTTRCSAS